MMKFIVLLIGCVALLAGFASSQEVVITDFPVGVGGDVAQDFFKSYHAGLKAISDTLDKYPMVHAIITGGADGLRYRHNNDANNPGLALGRAHVLRDFMINKFNVDSTQLVIQSEDVKQKGGRYRYAAIRIARELSDLENRLHAVENRPPVEKHFTEVREVTGYLSEHLGLQFGLGLSSSPFAGIPIATGAVTWKRIVYLEGIVGHTFWNNTFRYKNVDLDTKRRLIGGYMIFYPYDDIPVGIVGGWIRIEEMAQDYYKYVKLSEGPLLGLRAAPFEFISITGAYNPSRHRIAGDIKSKAKNGQFLVFIAAHIAIGGEK